jgi:uncharacterized protein YjbI with pentapeptide repeats
VDAGEKLIALLRQGATAWNAERRKMRSRPHLCGLEIHAVTVNYSTLHRSYSAFQGFRDLNLDGVDLHDTDLRGAHLRELTMKEADLRGPDLRGAALRAVRLVKADLRNADLRGANLVLCRLDQADLTGARLGDTYLGATTLSGVRGTRRVRVDARCSVDPFTLMFGRPWPSHVLDVLGLDDPTRRFAHGLPQARDPGPPRCFISYRHLDEEPVSKIHRALVARNIPCWYAPENLRQRLRFWRATETDAETARSLYEFVDFAECLIVVISPASVDGQSQWVQREVERFPVGRPIVGLQLEEISQSRRWISRVHEVIDLRGWRDPATFAQAIDQGGRKPRVAAPLSTNVTGAVRSADGLPSTSTQRFRGRHHRAGRPALAPVPGAARPAGTATADREGCAPVGWRDGDRPPARRASSSPSATRPYLGP